MTTPNKSTNQFDTILQCFQKRSFQIHPDIVLCFTFSHRRGMTKLHLQSQEEPPRYGVSGIGINKGDAGPFKTKQERNREKEKREEEECKSFRRVVITSRVRVVAQNKNGRWRRNGEVRTNETKVEERKRKGERERLKRRQRRGTKER